METSLTIINLQAPLASQLTLAVALLKNKELVAFPTETVYGLGANGLSEESVSKIFRAKGRPSDNPLILHISNLKMLEKIADISQKKELIEKITRHFWPGPLTLVLPKKPIVPDAVTAGLSTVAVRMPDHPVALKLIEECGFPLAAPSANRSGRPSPTSAKMVLSDLNKKVPLILDGGRCGMGLESTVLDLSSENLAILRPGNVLEEELSNFIPNLSYNFDNSQTLAPAAPGMKYLHYKPNVKIIIFSEIINAEKIIENEKSKKPVIITLEKLPSIDKTETLFFKNPETLAKDLYHTFYSLEENGADLILIKKIEEKGLGTSLMNRMTKAADQII